MRDLGITIYTDSGISGQSVTDKNNPSGGRWKADEINNINLLDLKAILKRQQRYCNGKKYKYVRVMPDNKTAISYVNNTGN